MGRESLLRAAERRLCDELFEGSALQYKAVFPDLKVDLGKFFGGQRLDGAPRIEIANFKPLFARL